MNLGHGGNVDEISRKYNLKNGDLIDFSANINPLGISSKVKDVMILALDKIERYPDITYHSLREGISKYEKVNYNNIIIGNGAAEVIFNVVRGLRPKKVLLSAPTFSEYGEAVQSIDSEVIHYILKENFFLDEGFIDAINNDIDMVFICNPNNPTGVLTDINYINKVLEKAKKTNTIVVIDESFLDFVEDKNKYSAIGLCNTYNNLIVVKSLTKFFAFPGIRVGYGITSNSDIIKKINNVSISWSINTVAAFGGEVALEQDEYIKKTIAYVKEQKELLYGELVKLSKLDESIGMKKLEVFKPAVNFIFFKINKDMDLKEELLKEGILIRSCNNYIGLDKNYYRVAVRTKDENIKLIEALRKVL